MKRDTKSALLFLLLALLLGALLGLTTAVLLGSTSTDRVKLFGR